MNLESFSIASCPELEQFSTYYNSKLTTLSLPSTPELRKLNCGQYNRNASYRMSKLETISLQDVSKIEYIDCHEALKLTSITGIVSSKNLETCRLNLTKLTDISFLNDSNSLETLTLSGIKVSDVDFLKNNSQIKYLDLSDTDITNVYFLKNKVSLTTLYLSGSNVGLGYDCSSQIVEGNESIEIKSKGNSNVFCEILNSDTNLTEIYAENCKYIVYPGYLQYNLKITTLYLKGSDNILASELSILKTTLTKLVNYTLPDGKEIAFVDSNSTKLLVRDSTMSLADFQSIKNFTNLETLGLYHVKIKSNGIELTESQYNTEVNDVLSELTSLKYLALRITNLSEISFVTETPDLIYLDLSTTKVGTTGDTSLGLLNTNCDNLKTIGITSEVNCDLTKIQPLINKITTFSRSFRSAR